MLLDFIPVNVHHFDWRKNAIIFGVDISSSMHINIKEKYILVLGKVPTQG